ncbi:hypothetical protein Dimus_031628 [Dionaea muscipula]
MKKETSTLFFLAPRPITMSGFVGNNNIEGYILRSFIRNMSPVSNSTHNIASASGGKGDYQIDCTPAPRITETDKTNDRRYLLLLLLLIFLILFLDPNKI